MPGRPIKKGRPLAIRQRTHKASAAATASSLAFAGACGHGKHPLNVSSGGVIASAQTAAIAGRPIYSAVVGGQSNAARHGRPTLGKRSSRVVLRLGRLLGDDGSRQQL